MDLIGTLSDAARGTFDEIPTICLPAANRIHSADGLWRIFGYGYGAQESAAATPSNGSLVPLLSSNHEKNLNLVTSLINSGIPSKFFVKVDRRCAQPASEGINTYPIPEQMQDPKLPFEILNRAAYEFDPLKCGNFVNDEPCWFDLGIDNPYGPDMVLLPPNVVARYDCYNPSRKRKAKRRLTDIPDPVLRGWAWHPDDICPDYRVLCGTTAPPNLPYNINDNCYDATKRLIQVPMEPCDEKSSECTSSMNATRGRLPFWHDPGMRWVQVNLTSTICNAPTLMHARRMIAHTNTTTKSCGNEDVVLEGITHDVPRNKRRENPGPTYWAGWSLVRDLSGDYRFYEREKTNNGIDVPLLFLRYNYRNSLNPFGRRIDDRRRVSPPANARRPVYLPTQSGSLNPLTTRRPRPPPTTSKLGQSPATNRDPPTKSKPDDPTTTNEPLNQPATRTPKHSRPKHSRATRRPKHSPHTRSPLNPPATSKRDESPATRSPMDPPTTSKLDRSPATNRPLHPLTTRTPKHSRPKHSRATRRPTHSPHTRSPLDPPATSKLDESPATRSPMNPPATSKLDESPETRSPMNPPATSKLDESPETSKPLYPPATSRHRDPPAPSRSVLREQILSVGPGAPPATSKMDDSSAASSRWSSKSAMGVKAALAATVLMARNV